MRAKFLTLVTGFGLIATVFGYSLAAQAEQTSEPSLVIHQNGEVKVHEEPSAEQDNAADEGTINPEEDKEKPESMDKVEQEDAAQDAIRAQEEAEERKEDVAQEADSLND